VSSYPVSPVDVRREIWLSLLGMVRVYAHAASLNGGAYGVENSGETAWLTYAESALRLRYSPETGAADWLLEHAGQTVEGTFEIDDHGRLFFPEGPRELDEAAIHWVQQVGASAVEESVKTS
jgi:hypothetical protein